MRTITIHRRRSDGRRIGTADLAAHVDSGIAIHRNPASGWDVTHVATGEVMRAGLPWYRALKAAALARRWPAWVRSCTDLAAIQAWGHHDGAPARAALQAA